MSSRIIVSTIALVVTIALLSLSHAEIKGYQSYGTCFQNITTDREETGFIQIVALSINRTQILVEGDNASFHQFETVNMMAGLGQADAFNFTPRFNDRLRRPDPVSILSPRVSNFGIVVSSDEPVHLYGIKSDRGTTDGYMCLPQTNNSKEFMIVGWEKLADRPFLASIMAVPVEDGTCCELYKIHNGDKYERVANEVVNKFQLFRYFAAYHRYVDANGNFQQDYSKGEDLTGYYLNCSRPVQVIFGHECAWVPGPENLFCDYIAEQMVPINQLGRYHVVPMIIGRSAAAGYIVRVVPSQDNTEIRYLGNQMLVKRLGEFLQFDYPRTNEATVVECSKPCAVYMYNKGYLQYNDVPTDPFMMLVVPNDRFTAGAPFGTASFCRDRNALIEFDNAVTIVTYAAYKDQIRFDDEPIASVINQRVGSVPWTEMLAGGERMVVTSFRVPHGFHFVSMAPGNVGSFAVYAYGHSPDRDSSSAYGFSCNYNSTGEPVRKTFVEGQKAYPDSADAERNITCQNEAWLIGTVVSSRPFGYAPFPFTLRARFEPSVRLSSECLARYRDTLMKTLQEFTKKINKWICLTKNCSYLLGEGVVIDYNKLKVDFIGTEGLYTGVEVYVEMIARPDVTVQNFATCRAEIQRYMHEFINWPPTYSRYLLNQISGASCPWPLPFQQPRFIAKQMECPAVY